MPDARTPSYDDYNYSIIYVYYMIMKDLLTCRQFHQLFSGAFFVRKFVQTQNSKQRKDLSMKKASEKR